MGSPTFTPSTNGGKPFPNSLDKSGGGTPVRAEPTLLGRRDIAHGRWTVEDCRAVRGEPRTDVTNRVMFAPAGDSELADVIRGHEMVHAKVSPTTEQFEKWVKREIASQTALTVSEELRVNFLCQKVGIDVKSHLSDGSELATGERMALAKDWAGCVAMAVATAGTAGHKHFLNGVRRHDRAWGDHLLDIGKRAIREMKRADKAGYLGSTDIAGDGLAPYGFHYTEVVAEWVDRLASFPPPKGRLTTGKKGKKGDKSLDKSEGEKAHSNLHDAEEGEEGDKSGNPLDEITPITDDLRGVPKWGELVVERMPMPRLSKGGIGKKRVATNMGRRPRRIHRYLTDPSMRIFDRTVRGSGGMVIIDASGSMSFTTEQIAQIIEHAPGATVALYSWRREGATNLWVVADKGRMVEGVESIDYGHGNGVDYPALVWGVKNRREANTPLVWVTDGGVVGVQDNFHGTLAMQCLNYARKNRFIIVPHVEEAIEQLRNLSKGGQAKSVYPDMFQQVWKQYMGNLPLN